MSRANALLFGPELLWAIFYMISLAIIKWTASPVKTMDSFWMSMTYIIALVLVPLTFGFYFVPLAIKSWLLLRIWIAGLVGGHLVLNQCLLAHSAQGPGVGTAYMVGMFLILIVLVIGSVWALIKF